MTFAFQYSHRTNEYATHQPVLFEAVMRSTGPVIEFGCGEGSTHLLHALCAEQGRELLTLENDLNWLNRYVRYASDTHQFRFVQDWTAIYTEDFLKIRWGVAFIDSSPWASRSLAVHMLRHRATFILVHDCDYFPTNQIFGSVRRERTGPGDPGERNYDELFRSWREHHPLQPWPYPMTGPPTLIGSNLADCSFDVDYSRY